MKDNSTNTSLPLIQPYLENYQKDFTQVKNRSGRYVGNNTEKELYELNQELKKLEYNKLVFPKKIRNQKSLKRIKDISKPLSKIEGELRAYDLIDKEILNKKGPGTDQNYIKSFENTLKVRKQNLLSKSNGLIKSIESLDIPFMDLQLDDKYLQKRTKKLTNSVDKLTKDIGKKVMKLDSENIIVSTNYDVSKNILKLQKRCEKLKHILDTLTHLPRQDDIKSDYQKSDHVVIKNCNKIYRILQDINSINLATILLKQAGSEYYLTKAVDKINDDLQSKQRQFIEICKHFSEANTSNITETNVTEAKSNSQVKNA